MRAKILQFQRNITNTCFGSFGWGDGEWMRDWVDRMNRSGAEVIGNEGIIAHEAPGDTEIALCKEMGKTLAGL